MAWVRIEDDFYDNDKFEAVGALGVALQLAALAYCNRNLTDGMIPRSKLSGLLDFDGIVLKTSENDMGASFEDDPLPLVVDLMIRVGLLHEPGHDCEDCPQPDLRKLVIHDYLRYQPSREQVERKRDGSRERMAKSRRNRATSSPKVAEGVAEDVAPQREENTERSSGAPNPNPKEGSNEPSGGDKSPPPRKRGSRLPDIFPITDEMRDWGRENAPLVDARREHEKFCDYWRGVSGQRGVKADWVATWRNWMRRAQDDLAPRQRQDADGTPDWMLA